MSIMDESNRELRKRQDDLTERVSSVEGRISYLEGIVKGNGTPGLATLIEREADEVRKLSGAVAGLDTKLSYMSGVKEGEAGTKQLAHKSVASIISAVGVLLLLIFSVSRLLL